MATKFGGDSAIKNFRSNEPWDPGELRKPVSDWYLEMNHGLDFKTPKFPCHVIYIRYRLDEENPFMQKILHVLLWMSYAMFVEAEFLN